VGVKFAKQINVRDFIRPDPFREYFSLERVDPAQLRGTLLYVEDSLLDQRIVKHYLRESSLNVKTAMNCAEAIAAAQQGVDLIVSDFHLPDCDGPQFVKEARDAGIAAPVIMVTSDNSSTTRTKPSRSAGLEPATPGITTRCSNQLSYGRHSIQGRQALARARTQENRQSSPRPPRSDSVSGCNRSRPRFSWMKYVGPLGFQPALAHRSRAFFRKGNTRMSKALARCS
jgi:CheY-like chemotaxis protein